jgi:hypothetical protein
MIATLWDDMQDEIPYLSQRPFVPPTPKVDLIAALSQYTPDFRELKNGPDKEFLVLVVDNMQKNRSMSHILWGAHYYGRGETAYNGFVLKKTRDGVAVPFRMKKVGYKANQGFKYPSGFLCVRSQDVGALEGDIFGVPLRLLAQMDNTKHNTIRCNREKNLVRMLHPRQQGVHARCFVYEGNSDFYSEKETDPQFMSSCSMKIRTNTNVLFN